MYAGEKCSVPRDVADVHGVMQARLVDLGHDKPAGQNTLCLRAECDSAITMGEQERFHAE